MRKVARFTGPQSHIVHSSSFFPPVEIFYDMVSVLTRLSRKLLQLPNFLDCRSLIPFHHFTEHCSSVSRPSSSSCFHNLYFFLSVSCTSLQCETQHHTDSSLCSLFVLAGQNLQRRHRHTHRWANSDSDKNSACCRERCDVRSRCAMINSSSVFDPRADDVYTHGRTPCYD